MDIPTYVCQFCGSARKYVETIIDDEYAWNEDEKQFEAIEFTENFQHTGREHCAICNKDWTGLREEN